MVVDVVVEAVLGERVMGVVVEVDKIKVTTSTMCVQIFTNLDTTDECFAFN